MFVVRRLFRDDSNGEVCDRALTKEQSQMLIVFLGLIFSLLWILVSLKCRHFVTRVGVLSKPWTYVHCFRLPSLRDSKSVMRS